MRLRTVGLGGVVAWASACPGPADDGPVWTSFADGAVLRPESALRLLPPDGLSAEDVEVRLSPEVALDRTVDLRTGVVSYWPVGSLAPGDAVVTVLIDGEVRSETPVRVADAGPVGGTELACDDASCAVVEVWDQGAGRRGYRVSSDHALRDGVPASGERTWADEPGDPSLHSGNATLDAAFALAILEARLASVDRISDYAFANGAPTSCDCFETGERWTYVWTRDTAYAVDLGLAWLDPRRAASSLDFKLSRPKQGGGLQIVQDTGTGGSWPVSTDRVVWARGAEAALAYLEEPARSTFAARALEALRNTAEIDRSVVFDASDGLYRGEQSFLDWREQTYPRWVTDDLTTIAASKSLSTNLAHHHALRVLAALATEAGDPDAARYEGWATDLRAAIEAAFRRPDGTWSTYVLSDLDPTPVSHQDWLGSALAATDLDAGPDALASWPRGPGGPPVIWPQQPGERIYHNRASWPFVTAYGVRAAREAGLAEAVAEDVATLTRQAALNLSHLENFEVETGANWRDDGAYSGPVVNSRRQLWSVGGYLSAVVDGLFGLDADWDGFGFEPTFPAVFREVHLQGVDRVELRGFPYRGRSLDVEVRLPRAGDQDGGFYAVDGLWLDGVAVNGPLDVDDLDPAGSRLVVVLSTQDAAPTPVVALPADPREVFSPNEPTLTRTTGSTFQVGALDDGASAGIFRDGAQVADGVAAGPWTDPSPTGGAPCYAAVAVSASGIESRHSRPACAWPDGAVTRIDAGSLQWTGGTFSTSHGRPHHDDWGAPGHTIRATFTASVAGRHQVELEYGNGAGGLDTGITAAVKRVVVREQGSSDVVGEGYAVMPHTGSWDVWRSSTRVDATFDAGTTYEIEVSQGPNMADLAHFRSYTAGTGGGDQGFGFVNISAVTVLARP